MPAKLLLEYSLFAQMSVAIATLAVMTRKRLLSKFLALSAFLTVMTAATGVSIATLFFRRALGISARVDYNIYLTSNYIAATAEYFLMLLIIYSVFRQAMKPLEGLHRAGKIIFRWVAGVSLALVLGMALEPHAATGSYVATLTAQIQQGISVLTLCLLLFVCFATRYLGLTYRSHIFGISLGLGAWATVSLVETAWYASTTAVSLYSPVYAFAAIGACATLLTWATYFIMPEPARKMVLLPTTSPFFLWNRISEALGDDPGFVAVAGFKPEMLAPAELVVLKAASQRVHNREAVEQHVSSSGSSLQGFTSIAMQG